MWAAPWRAAVVAVAVVVVVGCCGAHVQSPTTNKPHLILIVADDLGWNDVSWHNPQVVTPHLEALARGGVLLEASYVQPICTPTRSALLTGRYPFTLGRQHGVLWPKEPVGLTLDATLLPESLKKVGYSTHAVGKWHLGFCSWSYTPTKRGFDSFYGYYTGAEDYYHHDRKGVREPHPNSRPFEFDGARFGWDFRNDTTPDLSVDGTYSTYLFSSYIENLLASRSPLDPMFLYLPFQSVHSPLQVPKNYTKPYSHIRHRDRRIKLGMVTAMDEAVGRVVAALKASGHYNNSVIVFTTDNGGPTVSAGNNWPLRGNKTTLWEGGTRGAAFVHSPLLPNPGTVSHKLVHVTDWYKTFVGLAGGSPPAGLDGLDQWEALSGAAPSPRKHLIYNIDKTDTFKAGIRMGDFKLLVGYPGPGEWTPPPEYEDPATLTTDNSNTNDTFLPGYSQHTPGNNSDTPIPTTAHTDIPYTTRIELSDQTGLPINQSRSHEETVDSTEPQPLQTTPSPAHIHANLSSTANTYTNRVRIDLGGSSISRNTSHNLKPNRGTKMTQKRTGICGSAQHKLTRGRKRGRGFRQRDYKCWNDLLRNKAIRLFNLNDDPEERVNIASSRGDVVQLLLEVLRQEATRYVDADIKPDNPKANPKYWNNIWSPGWCSPTQPGYI